VPPTPREAIIQEAKQLAWLNNWAEAAKVLDRLDREGVEFFDEGTALFARAAQIRGGIESMSLPEAADEIAFMLDAGPARNDPELRVQLLAVKGDIEFQYDLSAAHETWEGARQLASSEGLDLWRARAEGELGTIAFLNGEIYTAVKLVSGALLKAEISGDVAAQIRYRTAMGEGSAEFGRTGDAIRFFDKALALAAATPDAYFPFTAYLGKARLLVTTGRSDEGLRMLREGLAEARQKDLKVREARILTVLGELATADGKQDEAVNWLTAATGVARNAGLERIEATASSALALLLRDTGQIEPAETYAKRSVAAARRSGDLYHLPRMMAALAEIEAANGNFTQAERTYAQATDLVDSLLRGFPHPKHKNTLIATMSRVFDGHFQLALEQLSDVNKAFHVLESARARGLVDLLQGTDGQSLVYPRMTREIAVLNRALANEEDADRRTLLLDRLWELEVRSIRPRTPSADWQELHVAKPVSLQRLQARLAEGELVIEYVLGQPRSFALAINRDRVLWYPLKSRSELESAAESHLAAVREGRDAHEEGKELYELLVAPVKLIGQSQRLVVIPDAKLHLVAFDALLDPEDRYLTETHVVSYAPSATAYHLLSKPAPVEREQLALLGVGGALYSRGQIEDRQFVWRGKGFFAPSGTPYWSFLPHSLSEVQDIAASWPGETFLLTEDTATEAALKRLPLSQFRVLHLALHSAIDDEFPDRSALVFASGRGDGEDGLLQAREILSLDLNADLVTLSACDAGSGQMEGIAGMNSLVQAFLMAGSRSVVASIWAAEDTYTAALMRRFYSKLREGFDKAEALTLAKRELLQTHRSDPASYLWAGFRLVGDPHGIVTGDAP
jgi:CHAT domain-containing protein